MRGVEKSQAACPEQLHVTGEYRDRSMQHTCSRRAAWDPYRGRD